MSDRRLLVGTRSHIYYVFYSTLLASCREAMTERCELVAELFYSVRSTTGDLWLFCFVDISFKRQFRDKLCQIAKTFEHSIVTSTFY
ncbi:hypothetical protein H6G97_19760 [Nostoc flagelliforme FACHB-838]|uniref:Transposase n=1 Tax=Nostoc flagelliforme FACHB-838 TaxID=2692904 RepID=A0ABR8DRF4_9NOSO|nr:hypothetical protein [Nostoc flagelliforme]MBD2531708.1 hypothetical protein [Nostoc flagelliforme FACHB-838]